MQCSPDAELQTFELPVHGDAECLKGPCRRVDPAVTGAWWKRPDNQRDEIARRRDVRSPSLRDNGVRNTLGRTLFPVLPEDILELPRVENMEDLGGRERTALPF